MFLSDELLFEPRLAPASNVVIRSDETQLTYELTSSLSMKSFTVKNWLMRSSTKNGKRFINEYVSHLKKIPVDKGSHMIINDSFNFSRRSMKELLLFYKPYVAGA